MKSVIITKMHLLNFKGVRELSIEFSKEGVTNILGRNGSGKTTIFDAFTWVLFGKDSKDRKQFDIKTLDKAGVAIPRLPHEVSITLNVDGSEITLTRRFTEKWTKKRGSATEEFTGHEEERLFNEVPCSLKDWNEKIASICPEQVFKFISNPEYFTSQKWELQRSMLFRMAGGVSDEDVAKGNKNFAKLLADMTGKTMEEYKREIGAKKKRIKTEIDTIPGRIDERKRDIREDVDFPAIRKEMEEKKAAIANIDAQLADLSKGMQEASAERQKIVQAKSDLGIKISRLESEIRSEVEKVYWQEVKNRADMERELSSLQDKAKASAKSLEQARERLTAMQTRRTALIAEYRSIMAETLQFSETEFVCPTCGRALDLVDIEKKQREMEERFNDSKAQRIAENKRKGKEVSKDVIAGQEAHISELEEQGKLLDKAIMELRMKLQGTLEPVMPDAMPTIKANPNWQALKEQEAKLAEEIAKPITVEADGDRSELVEAKKMLQDAVDVLREDLGAETTNANNEKRIKELETSLRSLSEELAELEGIEFTIAAFTKARIEAVEKRINSLFTMVEFRMYEIQINGGEVEKCEAMIDGVPYSSANNAGRINAGLDIINAICKFEGVSAPIFIDNAESVNELLSTNSQQIRLIVTDDEKLKIK